MLANANGPKILVADASPVSRKLVESALSQKAYQPILAATAQQAIELFDEHKPAVVIMSWMMPDLPGEELCRRFRSRFADPNTHIIVLTGRTKKSTLIEVFEAGADAYLTKPFHGGELVARVGAGLRLVELRRQIAAENTRLEGIALTDALTGLPNRRAIENLAVRELNGAARHRFSFWVVLADLDHFKQVNDTFGHDAGDAVLRKFSELLKSQVRGSDICGRFGGEEFLIVMTHATRDDVMAMAERIRTELQMSPLRLHDCTVAVTASFGVAGFENHQTLPSFNQLWTLADAALYSAKHRGRNRVEIAFAAAR